MADSEKRKYKLKVNKELSIADYDLDRFYFAVDPDGSEKRYLRIFKKKEHNSE